MLSCCLKVRLWYYLEHIIALRLVASWPLRDRTTCSMVAAQANTSSFTNDFLCLCKRKVEADWRRVFKSLS